MFCLVAAAIVIAQPWACISAVCFGTQAGKHTPRPITRSKQQDMNINSLRTMLGLEPTNVRGLASRCGRTDEEIYHEVQVTWRARRRHPTGNSGGDDVNDFESAKIIDTDDGGGKNDIAVTNIEMDGEDGEYSHGKEATAAAANNTATVIDGISNQSVPCKGGKDGAESAVVTVPCQLGTVFPAPTRRCTAMETTATSMTRTTTGRPPSTYQRTAGVTWVEMTTTMTHTFTITSS